VRRAVADITWLVFACVVVAACSAAPASSPSPDGSIRWSDVGQLSAGEYRSAATPIQAGRFALSFTAENTACEHRVAFGPEGGTSSNGPTDQFEVTGGETLERPVVTLPAGPYVVTVWSIGAHVPRCPWHAELQPR
jgi:hypothetical protein